MKADRLWNRQISQTWLWAATSHKATLWRPIRVPYSTPTRSREWIRWPSKTSIRCKCRKNIKPKGTDLHLKIDSICGSRTTTATVRQMNLSRIPNSSKCVIINKLLPMDKKASLKQQKRLLGWIKRAFVCQAPQKEDNLAQIQLTMRGSKPWIVSIIWTKNLWTTLTKSKSSHAHGRA